MYRGFGVVPVMQMTIVKQRERIVIEFQICFFSMLMDGVFFTGMCCRTCLNLLSRGVLVSHIFAICAYFVFKKVT